MDFNLIDKVCDRMFVLIHKSVEDIPFKFVKQYQKLGKGLKWITIDDDDDESIKLQMSFLLGSLHERIPLDIEFALLSDKDDYDSLISLINSKQRIFRRVKINAHDKPEVPNPKPKIDPVTPPVAAPEIVATPMSYNTKPAETIDSGLQRTAETIIARMLRSGNRPSDINLLKEYISINVPNLHTSTVERVITFLAMNHDIELKEEEVHYHF